MSPLAYMELEGETPPTWRGLGPLDLVYLAEVIIDHTEIIFGNVPLYDSSLESFAVVTFDIRIAIKDNGGFPI